LALFFKLNGTAKSSQNLGQGTPCLYSLIFLFISISAFADWGQHLPGVINNISKPENALYLTLDACGNTGSMGYDRELMQFLRDNKIPATLFINFRWIDENLDTFAELAADPLFKIENHGVNHRPASTSGRRVYGIKGTASVGQLIEEIVPNSEKIARLTGRTPTWYRSGTAYYDSAAIDVILTRLNMKIAGYAVAIDAGASLSATQVYRYAMEASSGDILLAHFNHPQSGTREGLKKALPELMKRGYIFLLLPDSIITTSSSGGITQIHSGANLQVATNAIVEIYNLDEKLISKQNFGGEVYNVSLEHLPKGLYIVKILSGGEKKVLKVLVR